MTLSSSSPRNSAAAAPHNCWPSRRVEASPDPRTKASFQTNRKDKRYLETCDDRGHMRRWGPEDATRARICGTSVPRTAARSPLDTLPQPIFHLVSGVHLDERARLAGSRPVEEARL